MLVKNNEQNVNGFTKDNSSISNRNNRNRRRTKNIQNTVSDNLSDTVDVVISKKGKEALKNSYLNKDTKEKTLSDPEKARLKHHKQTGEYRSLDLKVKSVNIDDENWGNVSEILRHARENRGNNNIEIEFPTPTMFNEASAAKDILDFLRKPGDLKGTLDEIITLSVRLTDMLEAFSSGMGDTAQERAMNRHAALQMANSIANNLLSEADREPFLNLVNDIIKHDLIQEDSGRPGRKSSREVIESSKRTWLENNPDRTLLPSGVSVNIRDLDIIKRSLSSEDSKLLFEIMMSENDGSLSWDSHRMKTGIALNRLMNKYVWRFYDDPSISLKPKVAAADFVARFNNFDTRGQSHRDNHANLMSIRNNVIDNFNTLLSRPEFASVKQWKNNILNILQP